MKCHNFTCDNLKYCKQGIKVKAVYIIERVKGCKTRKTYNLIAKEPRALKGRRFEIERSKYKGGE